MPRCWGPGLSACAAPQRTTPPRSAVCLLQLSLGAHPRAYLSTAHSCAVLGRWTDAAPYPEWELVTDEEPCADGTAGNGMAAGDMVDAGPITNQTAVESLAAGPGDAEQVRWLTSGSGCQAWKLTQRTQDEEEGGEDDMADFEDSAEQAHFSAFTARVRSGACALCARCSDLSVLRWQETLSRFCAIASTAN